MDKNSKTFTRLSSRVLFSRFFEYIYLYKDAVLFQIEQVTKLCSKIVLSEPWDPYDIPDNSTYEDQYYIGGPGDQIMVQEWSDRKPARKRKLLVVCLVKMISLPLARFSTPTQLKSITLLSENTHKRYCFDSS